MLPEDAARRTLAHYDRVADDFWEGTKDHDVTQNLDALLGALEGTPPFRVLDLGCGPGRDLVALAARGHAATGLDGSARFVEMARSRSGAPVLHQSFLALDLPEAAFDGIFANASLFHVPTRDLPRVLGELRRALVPGGVIFASNPRGHGEEGFTGERYCSFLDAAGWHALFASAGFVHVRTFLRPTDAPPPEQRWIATVWRAPATLP